LNHGLSNLATEENYIKRVFSPSSGYSARDYLLQPIVLQYAHYSGLYQLVLPIAVEARTSGDRFITNRFSDNDIGELKFDFDSKAPYTSGQSMPLQCCNLLIKKCHFIGDLEETFISVCSCEDYVNSTNHRTAATGLRVKELLINQNLNEMTKEEFGNLINCRLGPTEEDFTADRDIDQCISDVYLCQGIDRLKCTHGKIIIDFINKKIDLNYLFNTQNRITSLPSQLFVIGENPQSQSDQVINNMPIFYDQFICVSCDRIARTVLPCLIFFLVYVRKHVHSLSVYHSYL
jgi:hypothetical protein